MFRRLTGLVVLVFSLGLCLPQPGWSQRAPQAGGDIDSDKLAPGTFVGKLKGGVTPGGDFELEIEFKHLEPKGGNANPGNQARQLIQQQRQIAQARQRMAQARNPQEAARAMQQMQRAMANMQLQAARQQLNLNNLFRVVTDTKTIDFHAAGDLVVRTNVLPGNGYDEKGNPKTYTPAELKALKGNPNLPGYEGKLDDLKPGSVVSLTVRRAAADPKDRAPEHKNVVTMILVVQEGSDNQKGRKR